MADPTLTTKIFQTLSALSSEDCRHYMIVDAAQSQAIYPKLLEHDYTYSCLFETTQSSAGLTKVAPYLIRLKAGDDLSQWCINEGWHNHWGILFSVANKNLAQLRIHFKRLNFVKTEEGKKLFFRYYDPRVLDAFLSTCLPDERDFAFKNIDSFWLPFESGDQIIRYSPDGSREVVDFIY